jgi:hypothetical protein
MNKRTPPHLAAIAAATAQASGGHNPRLPTRGPVVANGLAKMMAQAADLTGLAKQAATVNETGERLQADIEREAQETAEALRQCAIAFKKVENVERMLAAFEQQVAQHAGQTPGSAADILYQQATRMIQALREAMKAAESL